MGRVKDFYWDQINEAAESAAPELDAEKFYTDRELEWAHEVLRRAAAQGQVEGEGARNEH